MTKRTLTKESRAYYRVVKVEKYDQSERVRKFISFVPPQKLEKVEFEFHGETIVVWKAPGQIINPKKVWKRYLQSRKHA